MPTIHCPVCELTGETASASEAEQWAALHNHLQHRGQPTAAIRARRWLRIRGSRSKATRKS